MADTAEDTSVEAWLDTLDPVAMNARDASHFRRILKARQSVRDAHEELHAAVRAARAAGDSWTVIGVALGVSKQAAQQRFGA